MDSRFPQVVDIDVPALHKKVDNDKDEAIVITLDTDPSDDWVRLFREEVEQLRGKIVLADVSIEGRRISFFASSSDYRQLGEEIKRLISGVAYKLQKIRNARSRRI